MDIAGFCSGKKAVEYIALTLAYKILKVETMYQRNEFDLWFNGTKVLHHDLMSYDMKKTE